MPQKQIVALSKEYFLNLHQQLLDDIYNNLDNIIKSIYHLLNLKEEEFKSLCCPVIVGGYAYWKHCVKYNSDRGPDPLFTALQTDDIDIKLCISETTQSLNRLENANKRLTIKSFRILLMTHIYSHAYSFLTNKIINNTKPFTFKIKFRVQNIYNLLMNSYSSIQPLELACLMVTYNNIHPFGLIDTTFIIRESESLDIAYLAIKQFYAGIKLTKHINVSRNEIVQGVIKPCEIIPNIEYLATVEFMMLDTVRMLSKIATYGDTCIARPAQQSDVQKFNKYVVKFIHLAKVIKDVDLSHMYYDYIKTETKADEKNLYNKWLSEIALLQDYLKYLPTAEPMAIDGGKIPKKKTLKGGNDNTNCFINMPDEFMYKEFGEIYIANREINKDVNYEQYLFKTQGGIPKSSIHQIKPRVRVGKHRSKSL